MKTETDWGYFETLGTFLSEPAEVHAFVAGFVSGHERADRKEFIDSVSPALQTDIEQEYHYFLGGRAASVIMRFISKIIGKS